MENHLSPRKNTVSVAWVIWGERCSLQSLPKNSHSPGVELGVIGLSEGRYSLGNLQLKTHGHVAHVQQRF